MKIRLKLSESLQGIKISGVVYQRCLANLRRAQTRVCNLQFKVLTYHSKNNKMMKVKPNQIELFLLSSFESRILILCLIVCVIGRNWRLDLVRRQMVTIRDRSMK